MRCRSREELERQEAWGRGRGEAGSGGKHSIVYTMCSAIPSALHIFTHFTLTALQGKSCYYFHFQR